MNTLLLTFGLLLQAPGNGMGCCATGPAGTSGPACSYASGPCYESSGWGSCDGGSCDKVICGSCCISHHGCCVKPIGDMYQHYPYTAHPKFYYYFRPYNHMHVRELAARAESIGAHPKAPFSNALFQDVYETVEARFKAAAGGGE
jgi:hypothetical protein